MKEILVDFGSYTIRKTISDDENVHNVVRKIEEEENCNGRPIPSKGYNESFSFYNNELE